jgi:hypothetical protein
VQLKKPIKRGFGIFLVAGLLLFIAGELTADPGQMEVTKYKYAISVDSGAPSDSLYGGGGQEPEEDNGDPDFVDRNLPWLITITSWLLVR